MSPEKFLKKNYFSILFSKFHDSLQIYHTLEVIVPYSQFSVAAE